MTAWIIALIVAGFALVVLEIFLPGIIAGAAGAIALLTAVLLAYIHLGFTAGTWVLIGVIAGACLLVLFWLKNFQNLPITRGMILGGESSATTAPLPSLDLIGTEGESFSPLRPGGIAVLSGKRYDVRAESELIESGRPVKVVSVEGTTIVVRELNR